MNQFKQISVWVLMVIGVFAMTACTPEKKSDTPDTTEQVEKPIDVKKSEDSEEPEVKSDQETTSKIEGSDPSITGLTMGKPFPSYKFTDMSGKKFSLDEYKGKTIMLDFWGFW